MEIFDEQLRNSAFIDPMGAMVSRLDFDGREVLYPLRRMRIGEGFPVVGGAQLRFPNFGKLGNPGLAQLPYNGLSEDTPFKPEIFDDNELALQMVPTDLILSHLFETQFYPWNFSVDVNVSFEEGSNLFHYCLRITNRGSESIHAPMPLAHGVEFFFPDPINAYISWKPDERTSIDTFPFHKEVYRDAGIRTIIELGGVGRVILSLAGKNLAQSAQFALSKKSAKFFSLAVLADNPVNMGSKDGLTLKKEEIWYGEFNVRFEPYIA